MFGRLTFLSIPHIRQTQIHTLASSEYINIGQTHWRYYAINSAAPNAGRYTSRASRLKPFSRSRLPENRRARGIRRFSIIFTGQHPRSSRERVCRVLLIGRPRFYITVTAAGVRPGESYPSNDFKLQWRRKRSFQKIETSPNPDTAVA